MLFFALLSALAGLVSCSKVTAPDCSNVAPKVGNRKLYIAACDSKWPVEVTDIYNTTSQIMMRNARDAGNLEIVNVCANLNWRSLGFLTKPLTYMSYAKKILDKQALNMEDSLIIFSDSDTFWSVDSVEDIFRKYDCVRQNKDIVMATETSCWVGRYCTKEDMDTYYAHKTAPGYSAFVNSGLVIGTPAALSTMFNDIVRNNGSAFIPKWQGITKYDDQMAFVQYYHKNQNAIALDYHQHLFGSIVTSHKSARQHTIPFVCIKQDAGPAEDEYDFNCDDMSSKAFRMGVQKMDQATCKYVRHPDAVKPDPAMYEVYRTLAANPVIWHGNGAGKKTFHWLKSKMKDCYAEHFGV